MANKMLVDAAHPEETRVVVLRGNRVHEFDFESASRKQLRGNIYLAKVTRVEPSLQAAFVDYGGNRHGFLAFSEIHPDYYQIPVADRQALIEAESRENEDAENGNGDAESESIVSAAAEPDSVSEPASDEAEAPADGDDHPPEEAAAASAGDHDDDADGDDIISDEQVDSVGAEDALEEVPVRRRGRARQYKIQEVIKRRQVLLVQVVKEERGNKGAALTTYLSLAGRYSVLMPNTARGGGISRKITSPADRKRLKDVVADLDVSEGMGVILRTAGASRTKAEVKRDFEYLLRLWENVRELTLHSTAPTLVYEEGSLIKRSIRDLYNKEIDEILVAGDDAYREAKEFMRMLMPSHAKNVKPYRESQPLFARSGIEAQLDAMFSPQVTLKSGGYLVINQTEALVSIDVNSGRSTREHNIEDTALQTNLEAAEEVARQLRLRDLAGLIVIDFIDMEEKRNNRAVERRMKDSLKSDRARIQVGRISHFGLLEMSRQRIRTGVLESTTSVCPTCQGSGHIRAPASVALHVLRSLEDQLLKSATHNLIIRTRTPVALYILNQKRAHLSELEQRFGLTITVHADETLVNSAHFAVERGELAERPEIVVTSVQPDSVQPDEEMDDIDEAAVDDVEIEASEEEEHEATAEREPDGDRRPRRRRRRRRGGADAAAEAKPESTGADAEAEAEAEPDQAEAERSAEAGDDGDGTQPRKRRRGRRGGRRGQRGRGANGDRTDEDDQTQAAADEIDTTPRADDDDEPSSEDLAAHGVNGGAMPEPAAASAETDVDPEIPAAEPITIAAEPHNAIAAPEAPSVFADDEWQPEERKPEAKERTVASEVEERPAPPPSQPEAESADDDPDRPKRSGWWQRRSFF